MSVKHKLLGLDNVSRDGELKSNSTLPFHSLFTLFPPPPLSAGLPTWPTKLCCLGQSKFSHRISLLTHILVWFYLLAAAVVVAPMWQLILAFNYPGFSVDASSEAFWSSAHFLFQTMLLDCCHLNKQFVCWIASETRTAVLPNLTPDGSLLIWIFSSCQTRNNFFSIAIDE